MKSLQKILHRVFDVRDGELGRLLLMSTYLLFVIASYTTSKAVRDSLFVTKVGPAQLPYMYLLIAAAMGGVSYVYSRTVNRIGLYRLIRLTSLISISNLVLFWWMFKDDSSAWFYVLYVWVSIFGAITASQCWLLATHVFNPREAKRVYAWIGVGGILGGILGGALTHIVALWFGTESLLLVCAGMMSFTLVLLARAAQSSRLQGDGANSGSASAASADAASTATLVREVRQSKHLSMMVLLLTLAVIVEAFLDYEYKFVAKNSFASKDQLTAFFGMITFYIGSISLLFQVMVTRTFLKRFGVGWAILLLPAGLLVASVTLAIRPLLWTAALLQLIDGSFSYSIHRSGMELLYLPIPPQTRNRVKGFIDMFVDRLGRAVGGLLLVLFTAVVTLSIPSLSLIVTVLIVAWIAVGVAVKREYLHSFRAALETKTIQPEALQAQVVDNATLATLTRALSSKDDREVLYALDLLSTAHPNRWRKSLQLLIQHPSDRVRARTIAVLAEWSDPSLNKDEFINHPNYRTARIAAASALSLQWDGSPRATNLLVQLLNDSSAEVVQQAIRTAGIVRYEEAIPFLVEKLADKRLRREAREGLLKFGDGIISELARRLSDEREPLPVRMRIPKVLAYTGRQDAGEALLRQLDAIPDGLGYRVLKGLNRLRSNWPDVQLDREAVITAVRKERGGFDRLWWASRWLESNPPSNTEEKVTNTVAAHAVLIRAIHERLDQRVERIFRLLALIYAPQDIYSAYVSSKANAALRATAIEFLDNLLEADCKQLVIPIMEDVTESLESENGRPLEFISTESALQTLMQGSDPWLQTIARDLMNRLHKNGEILDERPSHRHVNAS